MRKMMLAFAATLVLGACSTAPKPLVPVTEEGPASYVCYNTWVSEPEDVRAIATAQCRKSGMDVSALLGQSWSPLKCGFLTPEVAAFRCGRAAFY